MKKYYMAFVDFSEIENITADEEQLEKAKKRMLELGLLTEKSNPSPAQISVMTNSVSSPFFNKLNRRISRRPGGIKAVRDIVKKMCDKKEYTALFLYLCILYGFMEWQVPERIRLLPAVPDALKLFTVDFIAAFDTYMTEIKSDNESISENGNES